MKRHRISKAGDGFTEDPANSFTPDAPYYFDPDVYRAEMRSIFQRNWTYFCHASQLPHEGDYLTGEIAGQSVYVVRGHDGGIGGFFNVCQHELLYAVGQTAASCCAYEEPLPFSFKRWFGSCRVHPECACIVCARLW